MRSTPFAIPDVILIEPNIFGDERGCFCKSFNARTSFDATWLLRAFMQYYHLKSIKNVLRGLHYQIERPQGKLVRVVQGEVSDAAVDLRKSSKIFGISVHTILSVENKRKLWVSEGFAHGFLVLSELVEFLYKTTQYYDPKYERNLLRNDPVLKIDWPLDWVSKLAVKDSVAKFLYETKVFS